MSAIAKEASRQLMPFPAAGSVLKLKSGDVEEVLQLEVAGALEKHVFIGGKVSSPFKLFLVNLQSRAQASESVFFDVCPEADGMVSWPWQFVACLPLVPASPVGLKLEWKIIQKDFLLDTATLPEPDYAIIGQFLTVRNIWPILRLLEPYSNDWHNLLRNFTPHPSIWTVPDLGLTRVERETRRQLEDILPKFNPHGWQGGIDGFDSTRVTGWIKQAESSSSQKVDFYLNGKPVMRGLLAADFRADVLEAGFGTGKYGFGVFTPTAGKEGDILAFSLREPGTGAVLAFRFYQYPFSKLEYQAEIEEYFPVLRGWCYTPDMPDRIVAIDIYFDDVFYASVTNAGRRDDLQKKQITSGLGGFALDSPLGLLEKGEHTVRLEFCGGRKAKQFAWSAPAMRWKP